MQDHVAIPPDDAEGSGGRYLDPLTALAWLAAGTRRIGLGTGVLVLPYRPPLPTAKAIATVQELSCGRLLLGVGVGWMRAEFRALGVPYAERGRRTDEALAFLRACFASDRALAHGQPFLFLPRPPAPPIYVGGAGEHALRRTLRYADGRIPMTGDPGQLAPAIARLRELTDEAGRSLPRQALAWAAPFSWRSALPHSVTRYFEEQIDGRGALIVAIADREGGETKVYRQVIIGNCAFEAFVHGRRLEQRTTEEIPLHGIALDGKLALDESPIRRLSAEEMQALERSGRKPAAQGCFLCAKPTATAGAMAGEIGGEIAYFCDSDHAQIVSEHWARQETSTKTESALSKMAGAWTLASSRPATPAAWPADGCS